ncbi:major facilitator superfamily domain-containing protein 12-like isoform X1 [Ipomoea triloba]|uniref:major facilitator superfamily domain-containing protein 12-like isoform X1 n=1 Tax=Ipomoea triloba TaxID=35885 RepID=UPI00125D7E9C|nr:major facilitator superfamily domain-containing protein 12-like isoform X1 [Ipomoea triloba]XP_031128494.1 major facilitator superfamily domain-containing protein 12-like isoform X1 [Ipomoea triloba]
MGRDNREEEEEKPLGRCSVFTYGVGHMLNDITQCCWYTYLLLYLTDIGLSPSSAAIVTLVGQFADAFTTIIAGELIDRFGHFKIWHGAGCIMVGVSFISLFGSPCIPCKILGSDSPTVQTVGYCISAVVFCSGWSCTQISHMSMVNCITLNESSRIACVSCRNAFTMVASLMLYAVTFFVFTNNAEDIKAQYRWMAFISIFIGGVFVIIFHLGIKEPRKKDDGHEKNGSNTPWTYWLKKVLYYQVASIYVFTRVVTNVSQTFLAVYVINDLRMNQSAKSLVPAIIYLCSFITSVLLQELEWSGKRLKIFFAGGGILWLLCGGAVMLLPINMNAFMYALSVFIGIANALMMVTSIGMESALVDKHLDGSAFVYGSMGFIDKVLCGVALYFLESFEDADPVPCNPAHACFSVTRFSLGFIPGIAALLGVIVSFTMKQLHTSHKKPLAEPLLA